MKGWELNDYLQQFVLLMANYNKLNLYKGNFIFVKFFFLRGVYRSRKYVQV